MKLNSFWKKAVGDSDLRVEPRDQTYRESLNLRRRRMGRAERHALSDILTGHQIHRLARGLSRGFHYA